jgi:predicted HTH domain antitoxin
MVEQGLIMQVPFFSTTEEKKLFLVVLGAVTARFISLSKGAELLNLERVSFLELLSAMNVSFSYLDVSDIVAERSW